MKRVQWNMQLSPEEKQALELLSKRLNRSASSTVRQLVIEKCRQLKLDTPITAKTEQAT